VEKCRVGQATDYNMAHAHSVLDTVTGDQVRNKIRDVLGSETGKYHVWKNEVHFRTSLAVLSLCLCVCKCLLCGGMRFDLSSGYNYIAALTLWEQCSFQHA
jgi:hypothetical protein